LIAPIIAPGRFMSAPEIAPMLLPSSRLFVLLDVRACGPPYSLITNGCSCR
jgi:hypothetical protein